MSNSLIETITSSDDSVRSRSITSLLHNQGRDRLLRSAQALEEFRQTSGNLYHKVRASLFLFVIYRHYLGKCSDVDQQGEIPFEGAKAAFDRDFEKSLEIYFSSGKQNSAIFSAIADSYYHLSFKCLLDQVKLSISHCRGNHDLYNINSLEDYPFSVSPELTTPDVETGLYPVGMDASPVRLDPSHSGWSDIFFLGMDFPEGARVINMSVNLKVHGSRGPVLPPCECYCRYTDDSAIFLSSIDLNASKKISGIEELFNFGNDHLSLLKAGVVSSGIVPPCFEDSDISLKDILHKLLGKPGGIEIVTKVNGIPKGSRLAVSTTLLATIITRLMRFSSQIKNRTGAISDEERRVVASRAILGEWLGGSGGGWQDSGGLWPGTKIITGIAAELGHPEFGVSRGCLLPSHNVFTKEDIPEDVEQKILNSIVLVHGGISQDVGPVLEMVTEKYLLKYEKEWEARKRGIGLFDKIVDALKAGDMIELGRLTNTDWEEAIQPIIPWANNAFTQHLLELLKQEFGDSYRGFLMLGGMSGGGMAFIIDPAVRDIFKRRVAEIMVRLKDIYESSFHFIISPVVYDFELNHEGITSNLFTGRDAVMPEMPRTNRVNESTFADEETDEDLIKQKYGFDSKSHEHMKSLLKKGDIGLPHNRLPESTRVEDVSTSDIFHFEYDNNPLPSTIGADHKSPLHNEYYRVGMDVFNNREIAVVTFAGGMGTRWTQGAAVVKSINPFVKINGRYRSFLEVHFAKSSKTGKLSGSRVQHVLTTSYLTHNAIKKYLENFDYFGCGDRIYLSPSGTIGHRVYPMQRDLRFHWEDMLQQKMEDNVRKVLDDAHRALIEWSKSKGEGEDYRENMPILRFNPLGHWYEIPNLIKNGVLAAMINDNPGLKYLLCHNIDTMGAYADPRLMGFHLNNKSCLTFEVTPRRIEDAGGGLARVNGHLQLIEGLAMPRKEDEFKLSYYNTLTNWVTIDKLLEYFGLDRTMIMKAENDSGIQSKILDAIHKVEKRIPTYVTIKNVKYLWGIGQEDTYPVSQFEKLWGDMTGLKDLDVCYASVSRYRGQQLKEPALLDMWANDGSLEYVKDKCLFQSADY